MGKYEFTGQTLEWEGRTLKRIRYIGENTDLVKYGKVGGWIESENNLSQTGECFVDYDAKVYGNARVEGNAYIAGEAIVKENATVRDNAIVADTAVISGNAILANSAEAFGSSKVYENAVLLNNAVVVNSKIYGNARINSHFINSETNETPYTYYLSIGTIAYAGADQVAVGKKLYKIHEIENRVPEIVKENYPRSSRQQHEEFEYELLKAIAYGKKRISLKTA